MIPQVDDGTSIARLARGRLLVSRATLPPPSGMYAALDRPLPRVIVVSRRGLLRVPRRNLVAGAWTRMTVIVNGERERGTGRSAPPGPRR